MAEIINEIDTVIFTISEKIIRCCGSGQSQEFHIIPINKPTNIRIIVSALEVVHTNLRIVVVAAVAVGVDGCDTNRILYDGAHAPCVVVVSGGAHLHYTFCAAVCQEKTPRLR